MASLPKDTAEKAAKAAARRPLLSSDRALALAGFGLAALAAFFPWYVFLNQDSGGIRNEGLRLDGHRRGTPGVDRAYGLAPLSEQADAAAENYDAMITAAIPGAERDRQPDPAVRAEQPFPSRPFRLVHVANGQALIADATGMYLVHVGSKLPDNSELAKIEMRDGAWVIETSRGDVVASGD
ncbi:MAG: flagellar protein [Pararhizobium sp.]